MSVDDIQILNSSLEILKTSSHYFKQGEIIIYDLGILRFKTNKKSCNFNLSKYMFFLWS